MGEQAMENPAPDSSAGAAMTEVGAAIRWREGRVVGLGATWQGAQECEVAVANSASSIPETSHVTAPHLDGSALTYQAGGAPTPLAAATPVPPNVAEPPARYRALAYPALTGTPQVGDRVLLNTAAADAGLGTGGYAFVVAIPDRLPSAGDAPAAGHIVKARYTPLQAMVATVEDQDSPHHEVLRDADSLAGIPVVVADVHSALPAVIAGIRQRQPDARVAYIMTDGAALPAWFSRTVAGLRGARWLTTCITTGQAFGGDLEAVTLHSGLLAARLVAQADIAVVAQGPGVVGTGTRWGFSGVQAGEAVNAVATLGGRPVLTLRISDADQRQRHRGISHHSLTAYGRVALAVGDIPLPKLPGDLAAVVREQAAALIEPAGRHRLVEVDVDPADFLSALRDSPVPLTTMGRGLQADPSPFLAAAAAGYHAASLLG